jgi:hypothetical protein
MRRAGGQGDAFFPREAAQASFFNRAFEAAIGRPKD